jgi:eukaryotic-like serine/threonine-protein kinase
MRDGAGTGQGKGPPATNAHGVDTSKTLVQGHDQPTAAQSPIRVRDERPHRQGELLLERYRLLEQLGAGGFGTVWHAHDELLDRPVALKRIPLPSEEDRERATREALATARLAHPAIVALYEASATREAFYLISELVQGDTLAALIAADALSDEEVLEIGLALCAALTHAHARGVIHRDVKPHNVLVPSQQDEEQAPPAGSGSCAAAKLADFGGARVAGDEALTRAGDVFGTLAYMAPEQSEGLEVGVEADLYSLALVLYEALTGVNPVRGVTPAATARRIGSPIERLERRRRDLPRELTRALDTALDPDPLRRGALADLQATLELALETGLKRRLLPRPARAREPWRAEPRRPEPGLDETEHEGHELDGLEDDAGEHDVELARRRRISLPRIVWLGALAAVAAWEASAGRAGVSVVVLAAGAPLLALPRRSGPGWLLAGLAPVLGLAGLAEAFPALAGQRLHWRPRAALAALGFWWLALAEPLLARRLWLGSPRGVPPRAVWEGSAQKAATHVLASTVTVELLLGTVVWALAATILPWVVRGRHAALDLVAALVWTVALIASTPMLERALLGHSAQTSPHGALLGGVLGCVIAVCARALRGPV